MNTNEAIFTRRSIRKYTAEPVAPEVIDRILRAAMQTPTAHNEQAWEFIVVQDAEQRTACAQMSRFSAFAANAPLLIAPVVNHELTKEKTYGVWQCDMGAVCQTILLQTVEEGLGACWMACYPYPDRQAHLRTVLALPDHIEPYALIAIGHPDEEKAVRERYDAAKVHAERY